MRMASVDEKSVLTERKQSDVDEYICHSFKEFSMMLIYLLWLS